MSRETFFVKPKFGPVLRRIRRKRGLSLRELARQVDVDHTYISQIELGKVGTPVGELSMRIARTLDSPELMQIADYITVRQLLITELQRFAVYQELPPQLLDELGITDTELKEITDMCSRLSGKFEAALLRRQDDSSKWKRTSRKKGNVERLVLRSK
jgi:transcriptional regulator with XRE-family HTH domain